jgi:enterochelin esterase-like enzyme
VRFVTLLLCLAACAPAEDGGAPDRYAARSADALRDTIARLQRASSTAQRTAIARAYLNDQAYGSGWPAVDGDRLIFATLADSQATYSVAGDLNGWNANAARMTQPVAGFPFYYAIVASPAAPGSRYKLVRNGRDWRADPSARAFAFDDNGEISYVAAPTDRAHLERWPDFGVGAAVAKRTLQVYVPPGTGPFPVIYAQDGQNLWPGGWRMTDALAGVAPVLVVAVPNSPDRFDEYTQVPDDLGEVIGGGADEYLDFLVTAVKPFVDTRYPTRPDRQDTALLGSSLGGLVSLYGAWRHPDVFGHAASFSGTVGWGSIGRDEQTLVDLYRAGPPDVTLYVDSGGGGTCVDSDGDGLHDDGEARDNYCENLDLMSALSGADVIYRHSPGAAHNEAAWAARLPAALRDWFPGPGPGDRLYP